MNNTNLKSRLRNGLLAGLTAGSMLFAGCAQQEVQTLTLEWKVVEPTSTPSPTEKLSGDLLVRYENGYNYNLLGEDIDLTELVGSQEDPLIGDYWVESLIFSEDGSKMAFVPYVSPGFPLGITVGNSDGTNLHNIVNNHIGNREFFNFLTWSFDGKSLAYFSVDGIDTLSYNQTIMVTDDAENSYMTNSKSFNFTDVDFKYRMTFSPDGENIAFIGNKSLYELDLVSGEITELMGFNSPTPLYTDPIYSPDGKKIILPIVAELIKVDDRVTHVSDTDIFVYDRETKDFVVLNPEKKSYDSNIKLSPDGEKILFQSTKIYERNNDFEYETQVNIMDSDGSNIKTIVEDEWNNLIGNNLPPSYHATWSPDGEYIALASSETDSAIHISIYDLDGNLIETLPGIINPELNYDLVWTDN